MPATTAETWTNGQGRQLKLESELCRTAVRALALPMLHQFLNRLYRDVLAELERLDDLTRLRQHVSLDHPLVGALGVPLFANWD